MPNFNAYFAKAGAGKAIVRFKKGDTIFSQGAPADTIFYITKGRVKLSVVSEYGKEATVAIIEAGQFFGEGCLNGDAARVATAAALGDTSIISITNIAMREALQNEPRLAAYFVDYLVTRNTRVEEDLVDQLFNSSERRLARLLLLLAHVGKEGASQPEAIEISQATLADMIGTTRSRVSFFMNKFRKLGLISYNGKIHVHNSLLSSVLHEKPALRTAD